MPNRIFTVLLIALALIACTQTATDKSADSRNPLTTEIWQPQLVEHPFETSRYSTSKSRYYISLPENYIVEPMYGEDFTVHYFRHADPALETALKGGIYFGNYPSFDNGKEKIEIREAVILGKTQQWQIKFIDGAYSVQSIFKNGRNAGGIVYIHAFGQVHKQTEIDQLLSIFSTLRVDEKR